MNSSKCSRNWTNPSRFSKLYSGFRLTVLQINEAQKYIGVSSCILYHESKSNTLTGDSVQHWQWQFQQRDQDIFVLHDQTTTAYVPGAAAMASCNMSSVKVQYFVHGSSAHVHMDRTEWNKTVSIHPCLRKIQTHGAHRLHSCLQD